MNYLITTPCGKIQGTECSLPKVAAFKGIRYATAGRWEYPVQVTGWDGIYDATEYGNCSYQPRAFYDEEKMPEKAFYYKAMLWAVEKGITKGVSSTEFAPSKVCSRGEVATFLWRAVGSPESNNQKHPFTDISAMVMPI